MSSLAKNLAGVFLYSVAGNLSTKNGRGTFGSEGVGGLGPEFFS
jgi:hypothetical protein